MNFRYVGVVFLNCDPSSGQKTALANDTAFGQTLRSSYGTDFADASSIFDSLHTQLDGITKAGESQQGESAAELATKNSQAINAAAGANKNIQAAIGQKAGMSGATPGVESGVTQAVRANAATQVENNLSNKEADITKENYDIGRENYEKAVGAEEALPGVFSTSNQAAGEAVGAAKVTDDQANANAAASSSWMGLVGGLADSAVGGLTGGIGSSLGKKITGCWIAAATYDGWSDPRVDTVRQWLFNTWANESIVGYFVTRLYLAIGEQVASIVKVSPSLKKIFKRLFDVVLTKAENSTQGEV